MEMLLSLKIHAVLFYSICLCCFLQCTPPTTTKDNNPSTQHDSIELNQQPDSIVKLSTISSKEKLPVWPEKAKKAKGKRYPFDEGKKDAEFVSFREKLFQAVLKKDTGFLSSIIHDNIKFSFGVENGKEEFLKAWKLDSNPSQSGFWKELETVLQLGGGFAEYRKIGFYAPYIFVLEDIEDPFEEAIIIGERVRLRDQPSGKSKITGSLSWDLVNLVQHDEYVEETIGGETYPWIKVKTNSGETGFVFGKYVRSPIDFRAGFAKYDGKWMMDLFIAGD